ncbi:MAG: citrate synthase [Desulfovibrio sp.]|nr:MAG: citrate synthase [Desulfovibrio sp.]
MKKNTATLTHGDTSIDLDVIEGSEGELGVDIRSLRAKTGLITLDQGYSSTGSCESAITFVDGENGVLRYRGYPIEELAVKSTFTEVAQLLIFGQLPTGGQHQVFSDLLSEHELLHQDLLHHFEGFPAKGQPMAILSAIVNSLGSFHPDLLEIQNDEEFLRAAAKLISKVRTIAAFSYRKSLGLPFIHPNPNLRYCTNFLHMMFSLPYRDYKPPLGAVKALSTFLIAHADHEQNCSASTVRMVGSAQANLFASVAAGICALWGRLHGGANAAVINMLTNIKENNIKIPVLLEQVKQKRFRLMGFGHRVYKSFDPRAKVMRSVAEDLLATMEKKDELLDLAQEVAEAALADEYFQERNLYPNLDFYSGIILRALGVPTNMFPVMFAMGRMPGWIAHWREESSGPHKIHRPRQIYTGETKRDYVDRNKRGWKIRQTSSWDSF